MAHSSNDACKSNFPKRQSKYTTLLKNKDSENVMRRDRFFRKVKQNGENRKWEVRGEQILRTDFLSRQKQWEEEQARRAQELAAEPEDEDMENGDVLDSSKEVDLVEQFLSQEDQELEATISMLEDEHQNERPQNAMTDYGSEDEEYDQYFMDIAHQLEQNDPSVTAAPEPRQDQEMDVIMN